MRTPFTASQLRKLISRDRVMDDGAVAFPDLHWMTAGLYLATGADAGVGHADEDPGAARFARWAPLLLAPLAGAAHIALALRPGPGTRAATRIANAVAVAVGAAGLASSVYGALRPDPTTRGWPEEVIAARRRRPSLAPLAFAAAGVLGWLLEREELQHAREHRRLERRARILDRLLPRRRARADRVIVRL